MKDFKNINFGPGSLTSLVPHSDIETLPTSDLTLSIFTQPGEMTSESLTKTKSSSKLNFNLPSALQSQHNFRGL